MKKSVKKVLSLLLAFVTTICMLSDTGLGSVAHAESVTLKDPVVAADPTNTLINYSTGEELLKNTVWDTIYFGSFPQREVIGDEEAYIANQTINSIVYNKDHDVIVDAELYARLNSGIGWSSSNTIIINGEKYYRFRQEEADYIGNVAGSETYNGYFYKWDDAAQYHFFKYEPIKWRVLNVNSDGSVLLISDEVLMAQAYNSENVNVTWETCSLRSFLNGMFYNFAFNSEEQAAIKLTSLTNNNGKGWYENDKGNLVSYETDGGNDTQDHVFIISSDDFRNEEYGFLGAGFFDENNPSEAAGSFNPTKFATSTTMARAMGAYTEYVAQTFCGGNGGIGGSYYWLRTPGLANTWTSHSCRYGGEVPRGARNTTSRNGVRPAITLNVSNTALWSYAGKLSTFANGEIPEETTPEETTPEETTPEETTPEETTPEETTPEETTVHEHTPGEAVKENEVAPTCNAEGSYDLVVYCTECGEELSRESVTVEKLAHTPGEAVKENEVAATCTAEGSYDEVVYCSVCNAELSRETKTVEKLAHTPGEPVQENIVGATCLQEGSFDEVTYCTICETELSRVVKTGEKADHVKGTSVIENEVAATCTAEGSYDVVYYCTVCGEEIERVTNPIEKIDHTAGEAVKENEVAPTCTVEGSYDEVVYCTVCNAELSRVTKTVEKLAHTPGEAVKENEVAATCTAEGSYDEVVYCTVCNAELSRETKTVEKLAHTPGEPVVTETKEATYTEEGYEIKTVYCTVCNEALSTEKSTIAKKVAKTPDGIKATNTANGVTITWNASESDVAYKVFRKDIITGTTTAFKGGLGVTTETTFVDTTAESGKTYAYTVRCVTPDGKTYVSGYNKTGSQILYLAQPAVKITNNTTNTVNVSWTASAGAQGYYIYRKEDGGSFKKYATVSGADTITYKDTAAVAGKTYLYTVRAYNGTTLSSYVSSSKLTVLEMPAVTVANNTTNTVNITWTASTGATGYYIYRREASGSFKQIKAVTGASTTSYKDTTAVAGTLYYYTVRAYKGSSVSAFVTNVKLTVLAMPTVKASLYKVSGKTQGITVEWTKSAGAKGYYVYRKEEGGSFKKIYTATSGSTVKYIDKTAVAGKKYYYTVRAYEGTMLSSYKSSAAITR